MGRPNAGKSSLFNRLTGGNAHVGNLPGVTVDVLEARARLPDGTETDIVDLPGVYSLEATVDPATDEGVARTFLDEALQRSRPVVLVQVLDSTQLALGLRLTSELLKVHAPFVVVATQRDALERLGRTLDVDALSESLGAPTLAVSAREPRTRADVLLAVQRVPDTWTDGGPISSDGRMSSRGGITYADTQRIARRVVREAAARSTRIDTRRQLTGRLDSVFLSHPLGAIIFLAIMAALFTAVFLHRGPGEPPFRLVIGLVSNAVVRHLGHSLAVSFLTDAVLGGAGTVLTFVPQIVVLTMLLELLDASGYLARGAFIADRMLRLLGLGGRSFVPLLLGHACAIPAIAATRVIRNPQERLVTLLVVPFMTCSARIPTYALILGVFFGNVSPIGKAADLRIALRAWRVLRLARLHRPAPQGRSREVASPRDGDAFVSVAGAALASAKGLASGNSVRAIRRNDHPGSKRCSVAPVAYPRRPRGPGSDRAIRHPGGAEHGGSDGSRARARNEAVGVRLAD